MEKINDATLQLKVSEALGKDVGRALARMDPVDIKVLNLEIGDILEIVGKRRTVCKVMPSYKDDRGGSRVQMDGVSRINADIALDEIVTVRKVAAQRMVLSPTASGFSDRDLQYIGARLDGLPVLEGDRIRGTLFGSRSMDFLVRETEPKGPVLIAPSTRLTVGALRTEARNGAAGRPSFSYEDVGGLKREVQRVREIVELPLRYPEVFTRLGIDAPKGILLYGPPGCGKTLIARAVAHETNVRFFTISGPEIMQKFYGESEGFLRKLFEDATKQAPAIIFIDEIDSIAPKRESLGGEHQVERRVVAQLLSLMDGLKSRGQVIVIAATNIPNAIDPALRRPGRFDREVVIPIPDRHGRLAILEIHSRGMPLSKDVDLPRPLFLDSGGSFVVCGVGQPEFSAEGQTQCNGYDRGSDSRGVSRYDSGAYTIGKQNSRSLWHRFAAPRCANDLPGTRDQHQNLLLQRGSAAVGEDGGACHAGDG